MTKETEERTIALTPKQWYLVAEAVRHLANDFYGANPLTDEQLRKGCLLREAWLKITKEAM